jgi:hypothetical protein
MSEVIIKATFPAAMDLLLRWLKDKGDYGQLSIDTMRILQASGRLPKLGEMNVQSDNPQS